jgi:MoaA/NifB/PqqE/SkfB family radical SAM enzyme
MTENFWLVIKMGIWALVVFGIAFARGWFSGRKKLRQEFAEDEKGAMSLGDWVRGTPLSPLELVKKRTMMMAINFREVGLPKGTVYTCDDCPMRYKCKAVFDAYNTNDDCVMEK